MSFKSLRHYSSLFFFGLGLVLLVHLVQRFGVHELWQMFHQLGPGLGYVLILPLFWYASHTVAWYFILDESKTPVSFWELLRIKLAGEAVNTLLPMSWMGGDPVRIYMLQKNICGTTSTASVVLDRTVQSVAVVLLVFCGLVAAWFFLELPGAWQIAFPMLTLLMGGMTWFFIHRQQKGIFDFLSRLLAHLGFKRHLTDSFQRRIAELDQRISEFYQKDSKRFFMVLGFHFLARFLGVVEIYLISWLLHIPLGLDGALFLASLSILVNMVFVFIPGSMGVMEGAYGALFLLMHLNPVHGVAIQLVRRLRVIFWILIGLASMIGSPKRLQQNEIL